VSVAATIFWICLLLVVYAYFLYPLLLFVAYALSQLKRDWLYLAERKNRRALLPPAEALPPVSLVICAYNEEACLLDKIANLRRLDYPAEKLEVIFVSDGSTDRTNQILQALPDPNVRTLVLGARGGKGAALNRGVALARHQILVLSDAATLFEPGALKRLVRHFAHPRVGVVCGSLRFRATAESEQTEGLYWRYESMLRLMEGRLGATLTASGAIYACRRCCFPELAPGTLIEDFVIPMHARRLGYRVLYVEDAVATDWAAPSVADEFRRRVRIAVGSFRSLPEVARTRVTGFTCLAFFSHKLLRWVLPFLLLGLLGSSAALWRSPLYATALAAQLFLYAWALLGFALRRRLRGVRYALLGYFLLAIHVAFLVGFVRTLVGREEATW